MWKDTFLFLEAVKHERCQPNSHPESTYLPNCNIDIEELRQSTLGRLVGASRLGFDKYGVPPMKQSSIYCQPPQLPSRWIGKAEKARTIVSSSLIRFFNDLDVGRRCLETGSVSGTHQEANGETQ
jgi:hypothetical protein